MQLLPAYACLMRLRGMRWAVWCSVDVRRSGNQGIFTRKECYLKTCDTHVHALRDPQTWSHGCLLHSRNALSFKLRAAADIEMLHSWREIKGYNTLGCFWRLCSRKQFMYMLLKEERAGRSCPLVPVLKNSISVWWRSCLIEVGPVNCKIQFVIITWKGLQSTLKEKTCVK